jgi:hypothetical protein
VSRCCSPSIPTAGCRSVSPASAASPARPSCCSWPFCRATAGAGGDGELAVAVSGGHGELFVQQFDAGSVEPLSELRNLAPPAAASFATASLVVGSGARQLVEARGWGEARDAWPSAANGLRLPDALRNLAPKPVYARAPDARAREAA